MHLEAIRSEGKSILKKLAEFTGFYLGGGTALALQIGYRTLVDFDMFCSQKLLANLLEEAERVFPRQRLKLM